VSNNTTIQAPHLSYPAVCRTQKLCQVIAQKKAIFMYVSLLQHRIKDSYNFYFKRK